MYDDSTMVFGGVGCKCHDIAEMTLNASLMIYNK